VKHGQFKEDAMDYLDTQAHYYDSVSNSRYQSRASTSCTCTKNKVCMLGDRLIVASIIWEEKS